uniref:Peptidase M14 carboxypeptidase A domain-containing protein n=1 Tax=Romanomermis culicivorax TaxID=13658 RepID=A0A915L7U3_ROMCU
IIKNDTLTQLVNFYILPVSNPDGYEYSRTINRDWRKNRSNCSSDSDHCCGTDLNRNFDFDWGVTDSPHDPCSELNSGPSAASEPETRSIKKFLTKLVNRFSLKAYLTLHSYGQFWFYPYGHKKSLTNDQLPVNFLELKQLADDASTAIYKMSRNTVLYKTGRAANLIYPSSGGSDDWAKGLTKVFDKIIEKYASKMEERRSIDGASNIFNSKSQLYM